MDRIKKKHLGYCAMFEQFHPNDMLVWCEQAEKLGFGGFMASDHFHPWTPQQGHSAFVWTWMGALGTRTSLPFGTGVTPPGYRYHPALVAQMACTTEAMFPGRFWLGLGAGEALNEHVVGQYWPEPPIRLEKLLESIEIIKKLFTGKQVKHQGKHFLMESAQIFTMPEQAPPILVATSGPIMATNTGRYCDGLITVGAADEKLAMLQGKFETGAREQGKDPSKMPRLIQIHVSWAPSLEEATENAIREWPNGGMNFPKGDVRSPEMFEAMARMVRPEHYKGRVLISEKPEDHIQAINALYSKGFDGVYIHNCGRNQSDFLKFYHAEVMPHLALEPVGSPG